MNYTQNLFEVLSVIPSVPGYPAVCQYCSCSAENDIVSVSGGKPTSGRGGAWASAVKVK